ncbi:MAG: response regulator [Lachnospiraceae bacterium]|nr:response regulator [Lachnospiraceae bacterium]
MDLSKIESGKMELVPVRYDFCSLLSDVIRMVSMKAQNKALKIKLLLDPTLPSGLYGDDIRLRQVLLNLMEYAVEHTERGSVTLVARRKKGESEKREKLTLHFEVRDTGPGMAEEDFIRLFDGFASEENRYSVGTGIGMSVTGNLLGMMGSHLELDSEYGEGSIFSFELEQGIWRKNPVGDLEDRMRGEAENYTYQVTFRAPEAEILVVDDNKMNRKVFKGLLKETGVRMDEASGGKEALDRIREKHYDLIFLDHMMPEMDGLETFRRIQESKEHLCQKTPVIVLTANAISGAREMYMDEGFQDYLPKPLDPDRLEEILMRELPKEKVVKERRPVSEMTSEKREETLEAVFPEIDGMEWSLALQKMKNAKLLFDTTKDFYDLNEAEAMTLERFLQQLLAGEKNAFGEFRIKVHSMKSSAALIGAMSVSALARVLEHAAAEENKAVIKNVSPYFLQEWRELKQRLKVMFPEESRLKKAPDYFMLLEYLRLLKSAIADMDIDTSDEIIRQLQKFRYSDEEEKQMEALASAVAEINADRTIAIAEGLEENWMQHMEEA